MRDAKKRNPNSGPPGIEATMVGKVTKERSTPVMPSSSAMVTPWAWAMKPRVENTPIPASSSKDELENATTSPVPVRLERRLR